MVFPTVFADVLAVLAHSFSSMLNNNLRKEDAAIRTVFIPWISTVDDQGRIVRPLDAPRPLTLCNCDGKIPTTSICAGLHQYSVNSTHPAQRCVSTIQMTDNILEIETALARCSCMHQDSGMTDFACSYPSVNHDWIFRVLCRAGLPAFVQNFLRMIYEGSSDAVECAGEARGHFSMARGVRQGCPASGFLTTMEFDPILRWLHGMDIPKDSSLPACLQPTPCAYADFAVAAPSLRTLMPTIASAFRTVDKVTSINLKYQTCYWVQYGNEERDNVHRWMTRRCPDFE